VRLPIPKVAFEGFGASGAGNDADMIIKAQLNSPSMHAALISSYRQP